MLTFFSKNTAVAEQTAKSNASVAAERNVLRYSRAHSYSYSIVTHTSHASHESHWSCAPTPQKAASYGSPPDAGDNRADALISHVLVLHDPARFPKYTNYNIPKTLPSKSYTHSPDWAVLLQIALPFFYHWNETSASYVPTHCAMKMARWSYLRSLIYWHQTYRSFDAAPAYSPHASTKTPSDGETYTESPRA